MSKSVLIKNGYIFPSDIRADMLIRNGAIDAVAQSIDPAQSQAEIIDATDCIVIPGLIEAHCHLDKTLWSGPWLAERSASTIAERIALKERNTQYGLPNAAYADNLLRRMISLGTTHIRTHTDVDPEVGLRGIELIQEVADNAAGLVSVEQVAFPQSGVAKAPGTHELLRKAARMQGVVAIGGVDPAGYDGDPHVQLRAIFEVADEADCKIDIHLHDPGTLGAWELELIAQYTKTLGMQNRVTVSHAFALSTVEPALQQRLIETLAEHRISIITALPYDRPLLPTHMLQQAGIALGMGNDNIDDLWSAFGSGDMLERAWLLAYRSEWRKDALIRTALEVATTGSAEVLQLDGYGVSPGCKADLVIAPARTPGELVVKRPAQRWVIKNGVVVHRPASSAIGSGAAGDAG